MGPSSTFGWGVGADETYSSLLEKKLNGQSRRYQVINAGMIGYSSFQGKKLLTNYFKDIQFDYVIVGYGVNDIDRHRFFFRSALPDNKQLNKVNSNAQIFMEKVFNNNGVFAAMKLATRWLTINYGCPVIDIPLRKRLSFEETITSFSSIFEFSKKMGAQVILLNTPHNFSRSSESKDLYKPPMDHNFFKNSQLPEAINYYTSLVEKRSFKNEASYYLSQIYRKQGNCLESRKYFKKALEAEEGRISRDLNFLNQSVKTYALENKLDFLDAEALLEDNEAYFFDKVHPSKKGHEKIAHALKNILEKMNNE